MASASASSSSMATNSSATIHPTLIGITETMQKAEQQRKERLGLARKFLEIIDAWAKTKAGTAASATVTPLIESIATIVTLFAIGTIQANEPSRKAHQPSKSAITIEAPRVTKIFAPPICALPAQPQVDKNTWVTVAHKVAKLPDPPVAPLRRKTASPANTTTPMPPKEDKRFFLRLGPDHE